MREEGYFGVALLLLLAAIVAGGAFVFWQEYQTARILAGFKSLIPTVAHVTRGGVPLAIPAAELAVGDVVALAAGMKVPADVRVASVSGLKVDNSMLTGEAEPVRLVSEPQVRCLPVGGEEIILPPPIIAPHRRPAQPAPSRRATWPSWAPQSQRARAPPLSLPWATAARSAASQRWPLRPPGPRPCRPT